MKDRRYSITPEFTGHESGKKRFVLRFCDKRVSDHATRYEAEQAIVAMKKERDSDLAFKPVSNFGKKSVQA